MQWARSVRILWPVICVAVGCYILSAERFGLRVPRYGYVCVTAVMVCLTILTALQWRRRVPDVWTPLVPAAVLWCPIAAAGIGTYDPRVAGTAADRC